MKNLKSHTIIRLILVITVTAKNAKLNRPVGVSAGVNVVQSFFISIVIFCVSFNLS